MVSKPRVPMQVSPLFEKRIKDLQRNIMKKQGKSISMRDITERIAYSKDFEKLEQQLLNVGKQDLRVNLDRRKI